MAWGAIDEGVCILRLVAFSSMATVLAFGAHVLGGGAPPAVVPTVAALAVSAAAAVALSRRRRRFPEISIALGAVQLVLHEVFAAAPATGEGPAPSQHVGHGSDLRMPVMHAIAVLVTAVILAYGERVFHLLAIWWRAVPAAWRLLSSPVAPVRELLSPVVVRVLPAAPSLCACLPVVRRGPPVRVC